MPNINDKNAKPETVNEKPNKETKKTRKPREKVRPIEELITLPETKLTEKEKIKLIKALKEEINITSQKYDAYKQTTETSFKQARDLEDKYEQMEAFYRKLLAYVDNQTSAFHSAINQAIKGGM